MTRHCQIIAEAGVNHNGSAELAFKLVDAAHAAGADIVKFQTFKADRLVTREAPTAAYQKANMGADSQYAMLKGLELTEGVFAELARYCARLGIGFLSTPFDAESAKFLASLGMGMFKVSSGDLTNLPFLRDLAAFGLPIILSTGMATLGEVDDAVRALEESGTALSKQTILHCTTEYPAPVEEVHLSAMQTLRSAFPGATIGYSDHTEGIEIPIAAVALGAEVIEKHFTLDRAMPGPDHKASLEPRELTAMVRAARRVEAALGDSRKRPTASEIPNRKVARKSIVAAQAIAKGDRLTPANITTRRPGHGLSPMRWDEIIGTVASRDFAAGELIER